MKLSCTACGRPFRQPKKNTDPLFVAYEKSAPIEDWKFFLTTTAGRLSPDAAARLDAMAEHITPDGTLRIGRPEWYRLLTSVQNQWRRETGYPKPNAEPVAHAA